MLHELPALAWQVFLALEWVVDNLDPLFVLKTDDDAYIDTAAMVAALRGLCLNADCRDERQVSLALSALAKLAVQG
jgi:hypothetical protein